MRRVSLLALCFLGIAVTSAAAQQSQRPDAPMAQVEALLEQHESSELQYAEAYQEFRPRFEQFVKQHKGTEAEARATLWLIQQTWWLRADGKMESSSMPLALDLIKRHPDSPQLALLTEYRYVFDREQLPDLYRKVLEASPHRSVQAAAHFGLAQLQPARHDDGSPGEHWQTLLDDFGDVQWRKSTYGKIADAHLNPLTPDQLAVGQPAPEIEGINENGEPMKLSDYKGRVVMLDFWGDW